MQNLSIMKYFIFIIIVIFPFTAISQTLFTEDILWSTAEGPGGDCGKFYCWSFYTKIAGDTTLNGLQYKKVVNSSDSLMNKWTLAGFVREDNLKVFYRKKNANNDCLLYDFSCSVGDTLNLNCSCGEDSKFIVDSIKYLPVLGTDRKHIYFTYLSPDSFRISHEYWIEGIGSRSGILNGGGFANCMTGGGELLICCSKNGEIIYQDSEYDRCFLGSKFINSSRSTNSGNELLIYPNPSKNNITISNPLNQEIQTIELIDLSGHTVQQWNKPGSGKTVLQLESVVPGMYLLKIATEKGTETKKFVIQL